jgi:hypothetical protein
MWGQSKGKLGDGDGDGVELRKRSLSPLGLSEAPLLTGHGIDSPHTPFSREILDACECVAASSLERLELSHTSIPLIHPS